MDGQSYLLLIRDEGGPPELQVGDLSSLWALPTRPAEGLGGDVCWLSQPVAALAGCSGSAAAHPRSNPALSLQFAAWVDAVVFVFSLEDEISFQTVYNYYLRLCSYRNTAEVPMVLVGTQGEDGAWASPAPPAPGRSTGCWPCEHSGESCL